jgi:Flp pilus assembly protein TadB
MKARYTKATEKTLTIVLLSVVAGVLLAAIFGLSMPLKIALLVAIVMALLNPKPLNENVVGKSDVGPIPK